MRAQRPNAHGMTLMEMVVVLAILGALAAMAAPSFVKHLPTIRLKGDARDVASVLRLARMRAVGECALYGIYFDEAQTPPQYIIFHDVNQNEIFNSSVDSTVFTKELYRKTELSRVAFANDAAIFRPDGSSNGGWVSLTLQGQNDSLVVDVLPSTGRVKVIR